MTRSDVKMAQERVQGHPFPARDVTDVERHDEDRRAAGSVSPVAMVVTIIVLGSIAGALGWAFGMLIGIVAGAVAVCAILVAMRPGGRVLRRKDIDPGAHTRMRRG